MKYKRTAIGIAVVIGILNVGAMIGHGFKKPIPVNYPDVGDYTSYEITHYPNGSYSITYRRHDPKVVDSESYTDTSNGVFGIGGRSTTSRSTQYIPSEGEIDEKKIAKSEECIKAEGGGESNGALVGASVATGLAPVVTGIPYIGWLASGWLVMFGQDVGSDIGGEIARTVKGC